MNPLTEGDWFRGGIHVLVPATEAPIYASKQRRVWASLNSFDMSWGIQVLEGDTPQQCCISANNEIGFGDSSPARWWMLFVAFGDACVYTRSSCFPRFGNIHDFHAGVLQPASILEMLGWFTPAPTEGIYHTDPSVVPRRYEIIIKIAFESLFSGWLLQAIGMITLSS